MTNGFALRTFLFFAVNKILVTQILFKDFLTKFFCVNKRHKF